MAERRYRDPVHNIISLDDAKLDDALIISLIDSTEFQRLRRIKQLGLALYTYQGAEHSRFTHSLGVMHLMTRTLNMLGARYDIPFSARVVARAAALLHDIGHGPFSHVIEKILGIHHEVWTRQIVLDTNSEVNQRLRAFDPDLPDQIVQVINHEYQPTYVTQLVSSQLDCDRMDYLLRDSLMTGAKYGIYDLEWILHALEIDDKQRIYVSHKGLYAVEEYLQARYYMFRQVYFHGSLRSAEAVLIAILDRALELLKGGLLDIQPASPLIGKILRHDPVNVSEYLDFDDHDLMFQIKRWRHSSDKILSDLCERFINRRLFKTIDLELADGDRAAFTEDVTRIVENSGFDPRYYLVEDSASDVPYYGYYYTPEAAEPKARIYIESAGFAPTVQEITEVSHVVRGMRSYKIRRLCFPAEISDQVYALAAEQARSKA
ncbi:MAG TPA: HD domain-containing protein [Blastocatellia bacterium]|nr:HD domain-containing protein [Blastocatellia bacterium]